MLEFDRSLCAELSVSGTREWLVTNGIGGYASGTIAGLLTRRYHGLLIAALNPPLGRTLMVTKFDETADYDGRTYPFFDNRWAGGLIDPPGHIYLERFHLDGTSPVWTYACGDALLEKRVWMQQEANTTYVRYDLTRAACPLKLEIKALVNYRDHHGGTRAGNWQMQITPVERGLKVDAFTGATPFYLLSDRAAAEPQHIWHRDFYLSSEESRGFSAYEDHLCAGTFSSTLLPGQSLTLAVGIEPALNLDGQAAYAERRRYEDTLLAQAGCQDEPDWVRQLTLAADQFIVKRALPDDPDGRSVIAGYHWFSDWGRDTMVALPGLTLATRRYDVARKILRTFAHFIDLGMLPNRFPDIGESPEYNTADATLWYFEALRAYHAATGDHELLCELYPALREIIDWHTRGTRYNIHVDPADGLLYAGESGVQLTWMDAKVGEWVVTPRTGKPVEVNALWYNALCSMAEFAQRLGEAQQAYVDAAERARRGFSRFWNPERSYCYDVLDTPSGNDATLRPNQLIAVSLPHSPLDSDYQRAVVDVCARELLTSHGLRSLSPRDVAYGGHYGGAPHERDGVYHQGTVWGWLIGPFVTAHLRVYKDPELARRLLRPVIEQIRSHAVGSLSEIFDGDPPFMPRGCIAQAWSVAEVLRAWEAIKRVAGAHPIG